MPKKKKVYSISVVQTIPGEIIKPGFGLIIVSKYGSTWRTLKALKNSKGKYSASTRKNP